ncbi:hypothetical protein CHLRE_07g325026v5 [Chlamydomonas reinhardtii]|uniref:Uncharacterized protein n=1 Tax=Chlamydomonas reinhardtii TaxID=3055 RepID=A0A2K3DJB2_CHLRE|nr:uncharacterized protein CHLRE_07g325026v5 [Chlamydomonas reinhardtii]PNW80616.1 hypothetical protein CHLRE_07g325026v5 [Chlamydomonas reinhardtii]
MPGQNVRWLWDWKLERSEHRSTDSLPASLRSNVFLTTTPNPYANHALALLAPHLGKGKDGPAPWK